MRCVDKANPVKAGDLVAVIGAGTSGEAAARLLHKLGARVRLLERNPDQISPDLFATAKELGYEIITGPHKSEHFQGVSLVVPSPGVPFTVLRPLLAGTGIPVMAELELASRFTDTPILAVTGTSGKTTTVSLCAAMLRAAGKKVFLGGNIGTPLSEYVLGEEEADVLVLEVSSFQLMGCDTFHPRVGVLLNISPNHLDQHADMNEYVEAKFNLFARQGAKDLALFGLGLKEEAAAHKLKARVAYFTEENRFPATPLIGKHNQANLEAAYIACREFGVTLEEATAAAAAFKPLPNRLELVGEWNGVAYINDSKCTTASALAVALESMTRPTFLLAGGVFKGGDLESLIPLLREKIKAVGLFGASQDIFTKAWQGVVPLHWFPTLEEAMRHTRGMAKTGDVLLLAPATSSFDSYANYKERGEDFRRIARLLQ